ncbi:MAG: YfcE family phosphodiesterase [Bacteroides sp.]|nr:YfcE family phosphodiesterase [Eubacterium sp.]MCM1419001.1 YfcE family phosphodiesterase [Roseburia sp.]MCM1462877.1 YfcE family phosphodiesterase [Bacteroides sp.]
MKIVVVADTHKDYKNYKAVVEKNDDADLFIHLGDGEHEFADVQREFPDKKFVFVQGECDFGAHKPLEVVEAEGYKILCVHGHEFNVQGGLDPLINEAKHRDCRVALFGHTHMYRTECIDGVYIMNPGAIDSPRGKNKPSYGVITIDGTGKLKMNTVALK